MSNSNYDIAYLRKYLNGELSPKEMYAVEREAQRDPMLADILMGMEIAPGQPDLSDLRLRILERTAASQKNKKTIVFDWKRLAVAASVVAILGAGILYIQHKKNPADSQRTANISSAAHEQGSPIPNDSPSASPTGGKTQQTEATRPQESNTTSTPRQYEVDDKRLALNKRSSPTAPSEKRDSHTLSGRPVLSLKPADTAMITGYAAQAKKSPTTNSERIMIRGYGNALASQVAGVNGATVQGSGSPFHVTVKDKETGLPISGVTIIQPNSKIATNTDAQGKATIQPSSIDSLVDIMALGYNTVALNMRRTKNLNVKLQPSNGALEEVVVTTMSSRKTKAAEPVWGWKAFNSYIKKKTARSRYEGTVRLSFYIDKDGFPTNINILQSANEYLNTKASEILLSGPKWKADDNRYVTVTFEFKYD